MEIKPFKVIEVTKLIKNILLSEDILQNIWIEGEISNFKAYPSGHLYFSLKDEESILNCVMFSYSAVNLNFNLSEGLKIWARGNISVYEKQGKYQFYIEEIQQIGRGNLYLQFLQLKEKLQQEGLFNEGYKKSIPKFPKKIAVITSPAGAVIKDIITTIKKRYASVDILLIPAQVQGEGAAKTIITALETANRIKNIDTIILARGGGSFEDLFCFNDEKLARTIFKSKIPIISGVGHEPDFTIADFVADLRAPTPTAAAQLAVPDIKEVQQKLLNLKDKLKRNLKNLLENYKQRLSYLKKNKVFRFPKELIVQKYQELDLFYDKLLNANKIYLLQKNQQLKSSREKLQALNPKNVLNRGYSICRDKENKNLLQNIKEFVQNKNIEVIVKNGIAECKIITTSESK